jgi:hypothetical protein
MKICMKSLTALLALWSGMAFGQATNSADVTGTVTDATGAVIPGVTVTVKDLDKGLEHVLLTNQAGMYDSGPIVPEDHYTIVFTKDGFGSVQRGPMILRIGTIGMNVQLTIGQTTQQIVVNDSAPLLETTTPEISSTLPSESLQALPQTGTPDWQSFIVLLPGTTGNASNAANPGMGGTSANGSMPFSNALLDGASTSSPMSNNVINTPIFDIIGEVKITNSLSSAQYGSGGLLYNQISKGGSNTFHGLAYDYLQNTALNAATYGFGSGKVPTIHWNDFGGQVSGPVIRNKIFFLFDWDHTISHGGATVTTISVPTTSMIAGDFTGLNDIYDPTTQTIDGNGIVTRHTFASEYGNGNKIPTALLDPVALEIQKIFPTVAPSAGITNNYQYLLASPSTLQKWFGRFDADPTASHHLSGSAAYNYTTTAGTSPVAPVNATNVDVMNTNNQISEVWTINSRTINEARAGFMGEYDLLDPATRGKGWPAKLGLKFAKQDIYPTIYFGSDSSSTDLYGLAPGTHANYKENSFDLSDVLTLVRGRHSLHFGGQVMIFRADSTAWGNINAATLSYTGVYTKISNDSTVLAANPSTGSSYADFLLGYTHNWKAGFSPEYGGRQKNPAIFVQDDFKFTPKLTLNLGLRWDGRTGWSDSTNNMRAMDTTLLNPATNTLGAMWYDGITANGKTTLQKDQMSVWLPRVGLAYQLGSKTTVRTGFGMYTFPWNVDTYAGYGLGNAKSQSGTASDSTNGAAPVVILSSDGDTNYQGANGASVNSLYVNAPTKPESYNGQSVSFTQYDSPVPYLYSWNLNVQRQLSGDLMAEVSYVGSHEKNLVFNMDKNQIPESKLAVSDVAFRPYPQYKNVTGITTQGLSDYHSLQASATKRMSNGLMASANYTWSHMTSNQDSSGWGSKQGTTIWQRAYDPQANHGASNFDTRQMFKAYVVYDIPFGQGRKYLNTSALLDEVIGGWTISGTWVSQGGHPFTPYMLTDLSYSLCSGCSWFPNQVGDPKSGGGSIKHWFNTAAYASPTAGTFGNMKRNSVYGPGVKQMNMSIRKSFKIYERVSFDFSANATNALNHPSFANPDAVIDPSAGTGHVAKITGTTVGGRNVELVGKIRF